MGEGYLSAGQVIEKVRRLNISGMVWQWVSKGQVTLQLLMNFIHKSKSASAI